MTAWVALMPDQQVGVVILTNLNSSPLPSALGYAIFDRWLGGDAPDKIAALRKSREQAAERAQAAAERLEASPVKGPSPSLALERYAGEYADSAFGTMKVALENGKLVLRYGPQFTGDLTHWHYDTFRVHWRAFPLFGDSFATFTVGRDGQPATVSIDQFGEFKRSDERGSGPPT